MDYRSMHELPDFVTFRLKGVVFTCLVCPWVDGNLRQVRYQVVEREGNKMGRIRSEEIRISFLLTLRKGYDKQYMSFILGTGE